MTYEGALDYVSSLQHRGWRLGLDRMERLVADLGSPHIGPRFFHVAGTNGKGSVTSFIQSILTEMDVNVGGYFSPYVYDFRERIQHRRRWIEKEAFARLTEAAVPAARALEETELGGPTEFEFKTAVGFLYWREKACEAVALEVGLGGRLDATNVVHPAVSILTRIALDHQEHLGDTIPAIAREKAGIIKPGAPVISATGDPEATAVVREVADRFGCPVLELGSGFEPLERDGAWTIRLGNVELRDVLPMAAGRIAATNAAVAVAALDVAGYRPTPDQIRAGLANGMPPGRMERLGTAPPIVLDGAHNLDAIRAVIKEVSAAGPLGAVVWSAATGHNAGQVLQTLAELRVSVIAVPMSHPRALGREEVAELARTAGVDFAESVAEGIAIALRTAKKSEQILVTGSFYLLAEAKKAILEAAGLDTEGAFEPA